MERRKVSSSAVAHALTALGVAGAMSAPVLVGAWFVSGHVTVTPPDEGSFSVATPPTVATTVAPTTTFATVPATTTLVTTSVSKTPSVTIDQPVATPTTAPARKFELPPVDRGAAVPASLDDRVNPTKMQISSIDVSRYPIREIGLENDGTLEIPGTSEIGWYRYGAAPGQPGSTVMAAHVTWYGRTGPFFELGALDPDSQIELQLDDGTTRWYNVIERATYEKDELPRERIWRTTGPETLVLITCGGDFNPNVGTYRHNVVVYAVPAGTVG